MELNKEKYKVLPLGRRNQDHKHKLDQAVTLPKTVILWHVSFFQQSIERKVGYTVLILHLSALGTAPLWGIYLEKKGVEMKRFWRWWTEVRRGMTLPDSLPGQLRCSHLTSQIRPSAESHWCHNITFSYESTSPHSLVQPSSPLPAEHSSAALSLGRWRN